MKALDLTHIQDPIIQSLNLLLTHDITSNVSEHRSLLREKLIEHFNPPLSESECKKIKDLSLLPEIKNHSVSLSHSPLASAIAWVKNPYKIGVDVEPQLRVRDPIILRIATAEEIKKCPYPHALFTAKEASWKCLNSYDSIPTISQIETSHWVEFIENWYSFEVSHNGKHFPGKGFFTDLAGLYLSFYIFDSTFV